MKPSKSRGHFSNVKSRQFRSCDGNPKSSNLIGLSSARDRSGFSRYGPRATHGPDFFPRCLNFALKISGNRQSIASFTHPSTISQSKFICVHCNMARKVTTVSKFCLVVCVMQWRVILCFNLAVKFESISVSLPL